MNSHPQIMPVNLYRKAPAARIVSVNVAQHYADIAVNETLFIYGILAEVTVAEAGGTVAIADSTFIERTVFTGSGKDDLTTGGVFTGGTHLDYVVTIDGVGATNTFKWSDDGGATWDATGVAIDLSAQALNNAVTVTFGAVAGHTLGNSWAFTAREGGLYPIQTINIATVGYKPIPPFIVPRVFPAGKDIRLVCAGVTTGRLSLDFMAAVLR